MLCAMLLLVLALLALIVNITSAWYLILLGNQMWSAFSAHLMNILVDGFIEHLDVCMIYSKFLASH